MSARAAPDEGWRTPEDAYWRDAMDWGYRNGADLGGTEDEALAAVNRKRLDLKLNPYRIIERQRIVDRLPRPWEGLSERGEKILLTRRRLQGKPV